jgi:quercetin dioxygenase-like cupin family protein
MNAALLLPHQIAPGPDRDVQILLADRWRKLVLIQLRRGALLADHTARVPITIQAVAGRGRLRVGQDEYALHPGVLVPVEAHALHNVQGEPDLAIMVSFFRQAETRDALDSTAKFE